MVVTILTHRLHKTAVGNYFVSADGQWFCLDTITKESSPLALLDIPQEETARPNPRLANGVAPTSAYLPLYALVLMTLMFSKFDSVNCRWGTQNWTQRNV